MFIENYWVSRNYLKKIVRMESVKIVVRFQIVNTLKHGEMMAVIGNCPELGNWDTSKSIGLWWQEGNLWRGSTYFRSVPKEIEYK